MPFDDKVGAPAPMGAIGRAVAQLGELTSLELKLERLVSRLFGPIPEGAGNASKSCHPSGDIEALDEAVSDNAGSAHRCHNMVDRLLEQL